MNFRWITVFVLCLSLLVFESTGQCLEDSHSSFQNQGWLSCKQSDSAIKENGKQHWIQYDFGSMYTLRDIRIWNHNVWGETGQGVKLIKLDYSQDGSNWIGFGNLEVAKAPGSWKYVAPDPIDLASLTAQYVMLTVLETWEANSSCAGIAELRFGIEATTSTDDNPVSIDQFTIVPNPAADVIRLEFMVYAKRHISIVNPIGQIVKEISDVTHSSIDISVLDLKEGLYYINIQSENKLETNSFVKI